MPLHIPSHTHTGAILPGRASWSHISALTALTLAGMFGFMAGCQLEIDQSDDTDIEESRAALMTNNGMRMNGLGTNGVALNGIILNGVTYNGIALNGIALNGIALNGIALNGIALNGIALNGIALNGIALNGIALNGIALNGIALNGIALNGIALNGTSLDAAQTGDMKDIVRYMAECALAPGQCITIDDVDGTTETYCGVVGLDTEWAFAAPDPSMSESMATCVGDRAMAESKQVAKQPVNLDQFKSLLRYLVECALPAGTGITVVNELGQPLAYQGALGLAPEWRDGPMSPLGQKKVSACLAARTNGNGQGVQISMRGSGLLTSTVERDLYAVHEGAFWADLFAPQPYVRTCLAEGGGLSGRVCAQTGTCGFELMGDCQSLCQSQDPGDGSYSDCAGETAVINTFLDLGRQVGFGVAHQCVREGDDTLWCWGKNDNGELGQGTTSKKKSDPVQVTALGAEVAETSAGHSYSCARKTDGSLWCWGDNQYGQVGDGSTVERHSPVQVTGLGYDVATIGMSERHSCATKTDGSLWCWGKNNAGAVGDGTLIDRSQPVEITSLGSNVARVSSGTSAKSTCAIKNDGSLWCWGDNQYGQLGDGTTVNRTAPVAIATDASGNAFTGLTDVCNGAAHSCARKSDGTVWCWGQDDFYQMGDGNTPGNGDRTAPLQVALTTDAAPGTLSCGSRHTCVVGIDSAVWCWGDNSTGTLGDGTFSPSTVPVQVEFIGNQAVRVIATDNHTCATKLDGSTWCWGEDEYQVLLPMTINTTPTLVNP